MSPNNHKSSNPKVRKVGRPCKPIDQLAEQVIIDPLTVRPMIRNESKYGYDSKITKVLFLCTNDRLRTLDVEELREMIKYVLRGQQYDIEAVMKGCYDGVRGNELEVSVNVLPGDLNTIQSIK